MRARATALIVAAAAALSAPSAALAGCPGSVTSFGPSCSIANPLTFGPPTVGPFVLDLAGCPQSGNVVALELRGTWVYATHGMGGVTFIMVSSSPSRPGATINGCDLLVQPASYWYTPNSQSNEVPCPPGVGPSCLSVPLTVPAVSTSGTVYVQLLSAWMLLHPFPYPNTQITSNGLAVTISP